MRVLENLLATVMIGCVAAALYGICFQQDSLRLLLRRLVVYLIVSVSVYQVLENSLPDPAAMVVTILTAGVAGFMLH